MSDIQAPRFLIHHPPKMLSQPIEQQQQLLQQSPQTSMPIQTMSDLIVGNNRLDEAVTGYFMTNVSNQQMLEANNALAITYSNNSCFVSANYAGMSER